MGRSTNARAFTMAALLAAAVFLLAMASSSATRTRLRSAQNAPHQESKHSSHESRAAADFRRSLIQTRNPQCTMPSADPCTLNTTAIGMVEAGYATYYDEECAVRGFTGCYTDGIAECRTCYLSEEIYIEATNATATNKPMWGTCPCCVTTTLAELHEDLEVYYFDYSIFNISVKDCTDAPTPVPTPAPTEAPHPSPAPVEPTPAPTVAPIVPTPAPTMVETGDPVAAETPSPTAVAEGPTGRGAPIASDDDDATSSPVAVSTVMPTLPANPGNVSESAADEGSSASSKMSTTTKIGIGVGVAAGVIILGLAGFGVLKASGRV